MMNQNNLNIFISGSSGFIGRHLKIKLKNQYKLHTPSKQKLNLNNFKKLKQYLDLKKPKIIIHLASSTKFIAKNNKAKTNQIVNTLNTTKNLLNSINKECKLIIFFGSIEEYGKARYPFRENYKCKPVSQYGKYKYISCQYAINNMKKKKLNYIWLRPSLTYGPNDNKERYLGYITHSLKLKKKIKIDPGEKYRDYLYIDDLCKILEKLVKNYKKNYRTILNVSSQNYVKLNTIPKKIEKLVNKKLDLVFLDNKSNDLNLLNSNRKLLKVFPSVKFTSFNKGLSETLRREGLI